ncbi:unnamed protein product [Closterium sp. NIES-53]
MATPRVLRFDAEGRPLEFSVWLLRARRLLESQVQANETLWAHTSSYLPEPADPTPLATDPTPVDSDRYARGRADVTAWKSRDAAVCTASEFLTTIKARYATPTSVSLGRLFLPFLFLDLASFERTADLITHMRSLDSSYRAASIDAQLALLPPPMAITIYFIATSLPDRLASVRDALLLKHPSKLTIELLESALKDVESNLRSVASASGAVPPPLFHKRGGHGASGGDGGGGGDVASGGDGSAGVGGAPCAAAGDSPAAAGGGDARVRQPPTGLPAAWGGAATCVVSLGASLAEVPVASVGTCVDTSPGAAPEDALLSFTLDSGASHCFFRDHTTLTPLPVTVSVALADPNSGPVTARYTTTLSCLAVPSGFLTGFHVLSFSRNLVGLRLLVSSHVGVRIEPSNKTAVCVNADTAAAATAASAAAAAAATTTTLDPCHCPPSVVTSCSFRSLAHPKVFWHHRMGHPSISRLRAMSSQRLVLGLPRVLPLLPPSLAPPYGPCVEGRLHATPHSSSLRPTTKPFETLHLDVWGPASRPGPERESLFLVVVDDYSRYTTVFPLAKKSDVNSTLIRWLLTTADTHGRHVSYLHSDREGGFRSSVLAGFCREQGIRQSWMLPESPQRNGVAERRIGLVMETTRTSMIQARASYFLWPYAVRYVAHQLNLWPRVSRPESSSQPTADPAGASFQGEDPGGASSRGAGVGAESVPVRGPSSGGVGVGAELVTAGDSRLRGAVVSGAVPWGATTGGAPFAKPREPRTDPVNSGGAGSGGGVTGSLESGPGSTTASDTTPPPHPYPTRYQARVRRAPAGGAAAEAAGAGTTVAAAAVAAAAAGGAAVTAAAGAAAAATSSSCLWSSDPRSPLSFSSLPPLSSRSGAVSWRSTCSSSVSTSTAEAEIYARAIAAQELRWLTFLLADLGERPSSALTLFIDNKATILLCQEPRLESRVKHINVRFFLLRELQRRGQARFDFVESEANTADIFTKALSPCDHQRCCVQLGLVDTGSRLA